MDNLAFLTIASFILTILIKLGFAAVYKHREPRTMIVIVLASILSYLATTVISVIIDSIIDNIITIDAIGILKYTLPLLIVTIILEGCIYRKFATAIPHPFYFALAVNVTSHFFVEGMIFIWQEFYY